MNAAKIELISINRNKFPFILELTDIEGWHIIAVTSLRSTTFTTRHTIFHRFPACAKTLHRGLWGLHSEMSGEREKLPLVFVGGGSLLNDADHVRRRHRRHSRCRGTHRRSPIAHPAAPPFTSTPEEIHLDTAPPRSAENSPFDELANSNSPHYHSAVSARVFARAGRVKCWVSRLAGARQGYRYGRAKERSGGPFCGHGPRYTSSCVYLVPLVQEEEEEEEEAEAEKRNHEELHTRRWTPPHWGECCAAPLVGLTCAHVCTRRFSSLARVCVCACVFECRVLFPLHTQTGAQFLIGLYMCVYVCTRAHAYWVNWCGTFFAFYLFVCKILWRYSFPSICARHRHTEVWFLICVCCV